MKGLRPLRWANAILIGVYLVSTALLWPRVARFWPAFMALRRHASDVNPASDYFASHPEVLWFGIPSLHLALTSVSYMWGARPASRLALPPSDPAESRPLVDSQGRGEDWFRIGTTFLVMAISALLLACTEIARTRSLDVIGDWGWSFHSALLLAMACAARGVWLRRRRVARASS